MNKISKVTPQARAAETSDLSTNLVNAVKQADLNEDDPIQDILVDLESVNNKASLALKKDKAESDLDEFDTSRDATYRSLLYLCKGFTHHPDPEVQNAALTLEGVMNKYGFDLPEADYSKQSALIKSALADLDEAERIQKADLLPGFTALKEQLREEQLAYKAAEFRYNKAKSKDQSGPTASELKKDLILIINGKLVAYLTGMLAVYPDKYKSLASQVAMLINELNSDIKQRRNKNK